MPLFLYFQNESENGNMLTLALKNGKSICRLFIYFLNSIAF